MQQTTIVQLLTKKRSICLPIVFDEVLGRVPTEGEFAAVAERAKNGMSGRELAVYVANFRVARAQG